MIRSGVWCRFLLVLLVLLGSAFAFSQGGAGSFGGTVFRDDNVNGVRDVDEVGIAGVELLVAGPGYYGPIFSGENGQYVVPNVAGGTYKLIPAPKIQGGLDLVTDSPLGITEVNVGPGLNPRADFGYHEECVKVSPPKILWNLGPNGLPNGTATVTFTIQNTAPFPIGWVYVGTPAGVTVSPNPLQVLPPIAPGGSGTISFQATGLIPETGVCFTLTFHSPGLEVCCAERVCFKVPECDCYQELESVVECLPDGSYQANLTLQNLSPFNVTQVWAVGQNGVQVTPTVTPVVMAPGGTVNLSLNITGNGIDGTMVYVNIMFFNGGTLCCVKPICIQLPHCKLCDDRPAICYARRPIYDAASPDPGVPTYNGSEWAQFNGKSVAAVTCYTSFTVDNPSTPMPEDAVFGFMNLDQYQCNPPAALGTDWALTPRAFHNGLDTNPSAVPEDAKWTKKYMGNVFAITFDDEGNVYVAQTSAYNADYAPLIQDFNAPGTPGRNHQASPNEIADRRLHGRIFKIHTITGKVTIFNEDTSNQWNGMPSGPDPSIISYGNSHPATRPEMEFSGQNFPEVGDVTFDYTNRQIFATSMDDGKIYRYNMSGQKLNAFDPWVADTGATHGDGFARWGEAIWGLKYHRGRLYFSRWNEDFSNFGAQKNEVWSVALNASGNFIPSSLQFELATPDLIVAYSGSPLNATPPISDISFMNIRDAAGTERAHMILSERGMGGYWLQGPTGPNPPTSNPGIPQYEQMWWHGLAVNPSVPTDAFTNTFPHRSRGLEYACNPQTGTWAEVSNPVGGAYHINLGGGTATNSAGGLDFDFDSRGCSGAPLGNRNWFTSDAMSINSSNYWYGLQGVPLTGGFLLNSIVIDLDGVSTVESKSTFGDVEIPCPEGNGVGGRVNLNDYRASIDGERVTFTLRDENDQVVETIADVQIGSDGSYKFVVNSTGSFTITARGRTWLCRKIADVEITPSGVVGLTFTLPNGDVDMSGEVDASDIDAVITNFGATFPGSGLQNADVDGSGEVDAADIDIVIANFGAMDE